MQIQVDKTLDVEVVEEQLAELWKQTAGERDSDDEAAVLRARVANLLVFVATDAVLAEVREMLTELTARHPSRVLIMQGARTGEDQDIEMSVETICQTDTRGAKRLSCEEVSLKATGRFVSELPSAALPLLVPDLSTFLWWRNAPHTANKMLGTLLRASDRLVIDSAEFAEPLGDLLETNKLYSQAQFNHVGVSDLNWARLTFWRGLLADFYDVPAYQTLLEGIDLVQIDYVAPERGETSVAPQAFFIAGWLASRLGWQLAGEQPAQQSDVVRTFNFLVSERRGSATVRDGVAARSSSPTVREGSAARGSSPTVREGSAARGSSPTVREGSEVRAIKLHLNRVERGEHKPGRLVQVKLRCSSASKKDPPSFVVTRSADNLHVLAEARVGATVHRGRVLPVRNRSAAQLLGREMEILCNDQIYQEAVAVAAKMIALLSESPAE